MRAQDGFAVPVPRQCCFQVGAICENIYIWPLGDFFLQMQMYKYIILGQFGVLGEGMTRNATKSSDVSLSIHVQPFQ